MGKLNRRKFCACDHCGLVVKPGNRYIHGHNTKAQWKNPEYKQNIVNKNREITIQQWQNPDHRKNVSNKISVTLLAQWADPNSKVRTDRNKKSKPKPDPVLCKCNCGKYAASGMRFISGHNVLGIKRGPITEEHRNNLSKVRLGLKLPKLWCENIGKGHIGIVFTEERIKNMTEAQNKPEVKEKKRISSKITNDKPETKAKRSGSMTAVWKRPGYKETTLLAIGNGQNRKPNNPETLIYLITQEYFTGWKYTGDYSIVIGGKNPDFVNEETKQIIEVYGDHWHKDEDPTIKAELYYQAGYETCVIWKHELQDLDEVILKLRRFCGVEY